MRVTIPKEIAELLGVREGDEMEFDARNHEVVIRKNVKVPSRTR